MGYIRPAFPLSQNSHQSHSSPFSHLCPISTAPGSSFSLRLSAAPTLIYYARHYPIRRCSRCTSSCQPAPAIMRSPIALSALTLLISSTLAAPLLGSAGTTGALFGSVKSVTDTKVTADVVSHVNGLVDVDLVAKGVIKGDAELKVFIDLLVSTAADRPVPASVERRGIMTAFRGRQSAGSGKRADLNRSLWSLEPNTMLIPMPRSSPIWLRYVPYKPIPASCPYGSGVLCRGSGA